MPFRVADVDPGSQIRDVFDVCCCPTGLGTSSVLRIASKEEFQRKLNFPRIKSTANYAETGRIKNVPRLEETGRIREVEELCPELKHFAFGDGKLLVQGKIKLVKTRANYNVPSRVPVREGHRVSESIEVKPIIRRLGTAVGILTHNSVWGIKTYSSIAIVKGVKN
jgi:hypothetical protein